MDNEYLRTNIAKLIAYANEITIWLDERKVTLDRERRIWFDSFGREWASKIAAEEEANKRAKLKQSAFHKLTDEERAALGLS